MRAHMRNQQKSVTTFFHEHQHAPERPPKTLSTPPHDAPGRLPRLPSCARLVAASQAARGAFLSPPPPLLLILLLLGCCSRRPSERPERAHARPPSPIRAVKPPPPPPPTLRPSPTLLPPPWQPPWRPLRSIEPLHQTCQRAHRRGETRQKGGSEGGNGRRRAARAGVMVAAATVYRAVGMAG